MKKLLYISVVSVFLMMGGCSRSTLPLSEVAAEPVSQKTEMKSLAQKEPGMNQYTLSVELSESELESIRKEIEAANVPYNDTIMQSAVKTYAQKKMRKALVDTFDSMGYQVRMGKETAADARDQFVITSKPGTASQMHFTVPTQPDENVKLDKGFKVASTQNLTFSLDFVKNENAKDLEPLQGDVDIKKLQTRMTETMRQFAPTVNIRFITN